MRSRRMLRVLVNVRVPRLNQTMHGIWGSPEDIVDICPTRNGSESDNRVLAAVAVRIQIDGDGMYFFSNRRRYVR